VNKVLLSILSVLLLFFAVDSSAKKGEPNYDIEELRPINSKANSRNKIPNDDDEIEVNTAKKNNTKTQKATAGSAKKEKPNLTGEKESKPQMSSKQLMQATKVKGGEKIKQKIEVRDSSADDSLEHLKDKLYPSGMPKAKPAEVVKKVKEQPAKPLEVPSEHDRKKVLSSLIYMTPDELDKIKKNQIAKTKLNTQLGKEQQQKIIGETEKFYDALKDMSPEQRESYVSEIGKF